MTGRGLNEHAYIDDLRPHVEDADVIALGAREFNGVTNGSHTTEIRAVDIERIRKGGPSEIASPRSFGCPTRMLGGTSRADTAWPRPDGLRPRP